MSRRDGFTLLEVLVALAVLAIALGAVIKLAASSSQNITELRDRTIAAWVAGNKVNELLLQPTWPALGTSRGASAMAGQDWHWQVEISATSLDTLRRLQVSVYSDSRGERALAQLAAFKGRY